MSKEDIQRNRLWNFRQIISAAGGVNEVARRMGRPNSSITQYAGPNPIRNIGDKISSVIEKTFGLNPGDLDLPPPPQSRNEDALLAELSSVAINVSTDDKRILIGIAKLFAERELKKIKPGEL